MTINDTIQSVWPESWLTAQKGDRNGLITRAVFKTGAGIRTETWTNRLYGFMLNLSHCTWTGTGPDTYCPPLFWFRPGPTPSTGHS